MSYSAAVKPPLGTHQFRAQDEQSQPQKLASNPSTPRLYSSGGTMRHISSPSTPRTPVCARATSCQGVLRPAISVASPKPTQVHLRLSSSQQSQSLVLARAVGLQETQFRPQCSLASPLEDEPYSYESSDTQPPAMIPVLVSRDSLMYPPNQSPMHRSRRLLSPGLQRQPWASPSREAVVPLRPPPADQSPPYAWQTATRPVPAPAPVAVEPAPQPQPEPQSPRREEASPIRMLSTQTKSPSAWSRFVDSLKHKRHSVIVDLDQAQTVSLESSECESEVPDEVTLPPPRYPTAQFPHTIQPYARMEPRPVPLQTSPQPAQRPSPQAAAGSKSHRSQQYRRTTRDSDDYYYTGRRRSRDYSRGRERSRSRERRRDDDRYRDAWTERRREPDSYRPRRRREAVVERDMDDFTLATERRETPRDTYIATPRTYRAAYTPRDAADSDLQRFAASLQTINAVSAEAVPLSPQARSPRRDLTAVTPAMEPPAPPPGPRHSRQFLDAIAAKPQLRKVTITEEQPAGQETLTALNQANARHSQFIEQIARAAVKLNKVNRDEVERARLMAAQADAAKRPQTTAEIVSSGLEALHRTIANDRDSTDDESEW